MTTVDSIGNPMSGLGSPTSADDNDDLRALVEDLGGRSWDRLTGRRSRPARLDGVLWGNLEETGLSRLTTTADLGAGPAQAAVLLTGLAGFACPVPVAETDLLAAWIAAETSLPVPESGPLTLGFASATADGSMLTATVSDVPWASDCAAVVVVLGVEGRRFVAVIDPAAHRVSTTDDLAGEPRGRFEVSVRRDRCAELSDRAFTELERRGAWARCLQVVGSLRSAVALTITHTRDRVQFGRSLSKFQSVQHELAALSGSVERGSVAAGMAVAAAEDRGFAAAETDFAVAVAKVTLGQCVDEVVSTAHQLHGAIGVTAEHALWLHTMRARAAIAGFGSPRRWSEKLGERLLTADNPWDVLTASIRPEEGA
ncbi:acyl-CoA dehydrogenase family protein [Nocardia jinanensis]|uniref:Acyl-CoA dehydrogenase n=1 Tax=Nocardia jinanensis TaxID=382504 RepID=A0A917VSD7_9NOCA|nr:acyl-CoA dehydrogenase family protein [Nocardia jinanensis]GGL13026.1 acyl-CoA dehydrogenase [Nocardia jinanensis]